MRKTAESECCLWIEGEFLSRTGYLTRNPHTIWTATRAEVKQYLAENLDSFYPRKVRVSYFTGFVVCLTVRNARDRRPWVLKSLEPLVLERENSVWEYPYVFQTINTARKGLQKVATWAEAHNSDWTRHAVTNKPDYIRWRSSKRFLYIGRQTSMNSPEEYQALILKHWDPRFQSSKGGEYGNDAKSVWYPED
jgi:hypothetical protein